MYGSKSSSALLQLHAGYILWPREYVHVYTQGNLRERKLQQAHNSPLAAHLPKVGRLLRVTTHMSWTTPLPPWVGSMWFWRQRLWVYIPGCRMYTVSGQLWSLYMYMATNLSRLMPGWWTQSPANFPYVSPDSKTSWKKICKYWEILHRNTGNLYSLWNGGMRSYNWEGRECPLFLDFLGIQKAKSEQEVTCSQK